MSLYTTTRLELCWYQFIFVVLIFLTSKIAGAQEAVELPERGVRHLLEATVKLDPNASQFFQSLGSDITASVTIKVRISDHSRESSFYGEVPLTISSFDPIKGSGIRIVWFDVKCHHERGMPKLTLVSLEGSAAGGQKNVGISAHTRRIGKSLPGDEVLASRRLDAGTDKAGPFIVTRTETKESRLFVDLKLYSLPCDLADIAPP